MDGSISNEWFRFRIHQGLMKTARGCQDFLERPYMHLICFMNWTMREMTQSTAVPSDNRKMTSSIEVNNLHSSLGNFQNYYRVYLWHSASKSNLKEFHHSEYQLLISCYILDVTRPFSLQWFHNDNIIITEFHLNFISIPLSISFISLVWKSWIDRIPIVRELVWEGTELGHKTKEDGQNLSDRNFGMIFRELIEQMGLAFDHFLFKCCP
jgi:hypothetical protein